MARVRGRFRESELFNLVSARRIRPPPPPSPRARGERLSYRSSIFWLPWHFISKDSIEDGEKLSRHGDNGDEFGLAGGDQLVAESFEDWVVPGGNHCGHEREIADRLSAATDEAFAAPLAGLAGPGR